MNNIETSENSHIRIELSIGEADYVFRVRYNSKVSKVIEEFITDYSDLIEVGESVEDFIASHHIYKKGRWEIAYLLVEDLNERLTSDTCLLVTSKD